MSLLKKKIVMMTDRNHPGTLGGIQTFNRILKKYFPEELIIVAPKILGRKFYKIDNMIEYGSTNIVCRVINKFTNRRLDKFFIRKKLKKINPDICILSTPKELEVLKDIKCKKILVQHTNFKRYMEVHFEDKNLIKLLKKELDYFVFLSDNDMKKFQKEIEFPLKKSIVIRHSSEIDIFEGIKQKNKKLIMIGRIENKAKRYDLAILAMRKLKDFTLLIYGDGPDLEKLRELVNKEKINNVIFKGPTNNVAKALDEASIFVMTSDYEGYGITNIEAMRRGLPIILRNTYEAAEDIVVKNRNGILLAREWNEDNFVEAVQEIYNNYNFYHENTMLEREKYNYSIIKKEWQKLIYY